MDYCPNYSGYLIGRHNQELKAIIARARCGLWSCEYCHEKNRSIWRARVFESVKSHGGIWFMMTITAHENTRTPASSIHNLRQGWNKNKLVCINPLSGRANKASGLRDYLATINPYSDFRYLRVYEPHKDGVLHMHFLTDYHPLDYFHPLTAEKRHAQTRSHENTPKGYGSRVLKDQSRKAGMGYMVDCQCVGSSPDKAVGYVLKYLTKELSTLPKGTRRIQVSGDFLIPQPSEPSDFTWVQVTDFHLRDFSALFGEGREVYDMNLDHVVTYDDFSRILWYEPTIP